MPGRIAALAVLVAFPVELLATDTVVLREDYQVLQRDDHGQAACWIRLPAQAGSRSFSVTVTGAKSVVRADMVAAGELPDAGRGVLIKGIPVGGPYTISVAAADRRREALRSFRNVLVGDIWVLGGQSNMFGIDVIKEKLPALPYLNMLDPVHIQRDAHWCAAVPPIHRIPEVFARPILQSQHPEYSKEQIEKIIAAKVPVGGIDCSYFFARKLYAESRVPMGLIPCAMGGALAIWDPREPDKNRYGFLAHHVHGAGGRVKGLLFFQGEQDAIFGAESQTVTKPSLIYPIRTYGQQFQTFISALRRDTQNPDLPVFFAQICRQHRGPADRDKGWEIIRETQRLIPDQLAHSHCVPTLDLDLMDGLHLDYNSLRRVGERMAFLALPYVKNGVPARSEIKLRSVSWSQTPKPVIAVEFTGVNGSLHAAGRPTGFVLKNKTTGEVLDWIYKVDVDSAAPCRLLLRVAGAVNDKKNDLVLYYGAGAAPYANLVDERDMAVPAFGPATIR